MTYIRADSAPYSHMHCYVFQSEGRKEGNSETSRSNQFFVGKSSELFFFILKEENYYYESQGCGCESINNSNDLSCNGVYIGFCSECITYINLFILITL